MCFPGWPESSAYLIIRAWTGSGPVPDWSSRHSLLLSFRVLIPLCPSPRGDCKHKPRTLDSSENPTTVKISLKVIPFAAEMWKPTLHYPLEMSVTVHRAVLCFLYLLWASLVLENSARKWHHPPLGLLLPGNRWTWALTLLPGHHAYLLLNLSYCTHSGTKHHWGQENKKVDKKEWVQWLGQSGGDFLLSARTDQTRFSVPTFQCTPGHSPVSDSLEMLTSLWSSELVKITSFSPSLSMGL